MLLRFSRIGCGKGCLSCGVIQKGPFCPCDEWRSDGLLSSRSELRFDRTVHIACSDKHWVFLQKTTNFQKAKPFANKNTCQRDICDCRNSSAGMILNGSCHSQGFTVVPFSKLKLATAWSNASPERFLRSVCPLIANFFASSSVSK